MTVTLSPELERFLKKTVESGRYPSKEVAIQDAVRLLQTRERQLDRLKHDLRIADEQESRGEIHSYGNGSQVAEEIKRAGRASRQP